MKYLSPVFPTANSQVVVMVIEEEKIFTLSQVYIRLQ